MANRVRATLTNLEAGPRGLETDAGLVMIEAGLQVSLELAPGEINAATRSGWFMVATRDVPRHKRAAR